MTIAQLNRKLAGIEAKVRALVVSSIKRKEKQIVRLVQGQLKKGEDAEGKLQHESESGPYGGYRDVKYAKKRKKKGLQTKYVDLKFTGDFQKSMFVKFDSVGMSLGLDATDKKKDLLIHQWGEYILQLNETNFDWLLDAICDDLYKGLNTYFK
jgi:hypothetical protein